MFASSAAVAILALCVNFLGFARAARVRVEDLGLDVLTNESCADKDSFCTLHLDAWCTKEAAQDTCVRSCCGVLAGPHYGNSYAAEQKRALQQKMKAMGSWDTVCSTQCPVEEEYAVEKGGEANDADKENITENGSDVVAENESGVENVSALPAENTTENGSEVIALENTTENTTNTTDNTTENTENASEGGAEVEEALLEAVSATGVDGLKNETCADKDSFCTLHLDTWCTKEAAQDTCVRSCCGVLAGPHYGNSYAAEQKRALQQKMNAMGSWNTVCSARCPVEEEDTVEEGTEVHDGDTVEESLLQSQSLSEMPDAASDEVARGGDVEEVVKGEACADKDSFCTLHLDTWCTKEAAQDTCVRSCCGVLAGPHYGNSYAAEQKRALQQKMNAMGSWNTVCSAQCPVEEEDAVEEGDAI